MTTTKRRLTDLSNDELEELMGLVKGSDSVELKLTVPASDHRATIQGLRMDPLDAQIRQVFFFDTPDLKLNRSGVVVRARRVQGRAHDSVIKLRPVVPEQLPEEYRRSPSMGVEVDAMPGGWVCSASMKGRLGTTEVREAVMGERPIRKLFTKEQRRFYAEHAPEGIDLDGLAVLGPLFVLKLNFTPKELGRKLVAEMWLYPDGSRILELSTKCAPSEMFQVAQEARLYLAKAGVSLAGDQQTKTKAALDFYSRELREKAAEEAAVAAEPEPVAVAAEAEEATAAEPAEG